MGLTIHYSLQAQGDESHAHSIITALHQAAGDLPFKHIGDIVYLSGRACRLDGHDNDDSLSWLICQANRSIQVDGAYVDVIPEQIVAFIAWPGEGCEEANFGLCQYPETVEHRGERIPTDLPGWTWRSFCKTQYASNPTHGGAQNFLRCHLSVIALLDKAKALGCLKEVKDEGKFWENRNIEQLTNEVGSWNQMIAALGGRLKDLLGDGVDTAIAGFPNFEQLEAAGQSQLPPESEQLAQLIKRVLKQ